MFDLKDVKIYKRRGSGNDFAKQEVMSLMIFRVNNLKMASAGAAIDLFSLDGLLPHFRPYDDTLENSCFQIFRLPRVYE